MVKWISDREYVVEEEPSDDEYIEKTSPMKFPPITSPMDTEPTVPRFTPASESAPPGRMRPPMNGFQIGPPMNMGEGLSDELIREVLSDEVHGEEPSDEDVYGALADLVDLTTCRCGDPWTSRGLHERECLEHYRPDVTLVARVAGWMVVPGDDGRERPVRVTRNAGEDWRA